MSHPNSLTEEMAYLATRAFCHLYVSLSDEAISHVYPTTGKTLCLRQRKKTQSSSQITYKNKKKNKKGHIHHTYATTRIQTHNMMMLQKFMEAQRISQLSRPWKSRVRFTEKVSQS